GRANEAGQSFRGSSSGHPGRGVPAASRRPGRLVFDLLRQSIRGTQGHGGAETETAATPARRDSGNDAALPETRRAEGSRAREGTPGLSPGGGGEARRVP